MQATDLTELTMRVTQLADALQGKPPTPGAMKVWHDTLAAYTFSDVLAALTDWPKSHSKPPVPFDILQVCEKRAAERRERETAEHRKHARDLWSPEQVRGDRNSPAYQAFCAEWRKLRRARTLDPEALAEREAIQAEAAPY